MISHDFDPTLKNHDINNKSNNNINTNNNTKNNNPNIINKNNKQQKPLFKLFIISSNALPLYDQGCKIRVEVPYIRHNTLEPS